MLNQNVLITQPGCKETGGSV